VRSIGVLELPSARPGSHVCWCFDEGEDFRRAAAAFLAEGQRRGERLVFVADAGEDALRKHLSVLGDVDRLVDDGSLVLAPVHSLYEPCGAFDVRSQTDTYRGLVAAALRDGYSGLRVAADATALVADEDHRRRFVAYEITVDRVLADWPMTAMCGYHRPTLGAAVADLLAVHPLRHGSPDIDPGFRSYYEDGVLRVEGTIDAANHAVFDIVITSLETGGEPQPVIDVGDATFVGVDGPARLSTVAARLEAAGRPLRVLRQKRSTTQSSPCQARKPR